MYRRLKISLFLTVTTAIALAIAACNGRPPHGSDKETATSATGAPASRENTTDRGPLFQEITTTVGLPAWKPGWPDGTYAVPEIATGGVALFDYDNDGRLDILQICHGRPGHLEETVPNRLFHQRSDGTFEEIANAGGIQGPGYAMGVAIGDFDNDGFPDVFMTRLGHNSLYRNNGDGTFTDVTKQAGLGDEPEAWSTSAAWFDYDRDGRLDLFVAHFGNFDPSRICISDDHKPDYCGPETLPGAVATLYHNNGDGSFSNVSIKAGIAVPGRSWGVVCGDLTGDGWPDIFVANDEERQHLWVNQHNGTFKEEALERGVALSGGGRPEAGMGVAVGDVANDGRLSLLITHIWGEKNTLYSPLGKGFYTDDSAAAGMASAGLTHTGWGCGLVDFDNDGQLDLAVVNGRVRRQSVSPRAHLSPFWNPYAEENLLFRGDGAGHFVNATTLGGDFTRRAECTRGLAVGDIDNDGRVDIVTNTLDNTLRLYRNIAAPRKHWLLVRALTGKRDALGARLALKSGNCEWTRLVLSGFSFLSSSDPRAHFGLGAIDHADSLNVLWPDGTQELFKVPSVDCAVTVRQGTGRAVMTTSHELHAFARQSI